MRTAARNANRCQECEPLGRSANAPGLGIAPEAPVGVVRGAVAPPVRPLAPEAPVGRKCRLCASGCRGC
eukprot:6844021-Alexandrium_andersonii.AAC.1